MRTGPLVTKALQIAEMRLGMDALSEELAAPAEQIRAWRMGQIPMSERKFRMLAELVAALDPNWDKST